MNSSIKYLFAIFLTLPIAIYSQDFFEGEIHYKIDYEIINKNIPDEFLEIQMGTSFDAFVKEDKYIMIYDTKGEFGTKKIIVRLDEGFSYLIYEKSDTIYKSPLNKENNKLLSLKKVTNQKKEVLGEMCDYVTLDYEISDPNTYFKMVKGKHFFNPKYKLNAKKYENHLSGFWNQYVDKSNAISIRNEHEYEGFFKSVSYATKITKEKISDTLFIIDNTKSIKIIE